MTERENITLPDLPRGYYWVLSYDSFWEYPRVHLKKKTWYGFQTIDKRLVIVQDNEVVRDRIEETAYKIHRQWTAEHKREIEYAKIPWGKHGEDEPSWC